jgi:hypothetical protein
MWSPWTGRGLHMDWVRTIGRLEVDWRWTQLGLITKKCFYFPQKSLWTPHGLYFQSTPLQGVYRDSTGFKQELPLKKMKSMWTYSMIKNVISWDFVGM